MIYCGLGLSKLDTAQYGHTMVCTSTTMSQAVTHSCSRGCSCALSKSLISESWSLRLATKGSRNFELGCFCAHAGLLLRDAMNITSSQKDLSRLDSHHLALWEDAPEHLQSPAH